MRLPRELCQAAPFCLDPTFDMHPVQRGLGGSPWHVAVCSVILCRARMGQQVIKDVLSAWPTPDAMATSDVDLEDALRPLGLHRNRARAIQGLSLRWDTEAWLDLRDLRGVGAYVAAAVELFCFGCDEHASVDGVLAWWADRRSGPSMAERDNVFYVDGEPHASAVEAYGAYDALCNA